MATQGLFLGNSCSQTLYTLDVARRFTNVGGLAHSLVRRDNIRDAIAKTDPVTQPVRHTALDWALSARETFRLVSVPYDFVVGTGSHRLVNGEDRKHGSLLVPPAMPASVSDTEGSKAGKAARAVGSPLSRVWNTWTFHQSVTHPRRVTYLSNRLKQTLNHPCDMGLLGTAGLWATLPVYAAASIAGAAIGTVGGTVGYAVLALADKRPAKFSEFVSRWAAFGGASAAVTMFGALMTAPAWLALQGLRVVGALAKGGVTVVGAGLGAMVGLAVSYTMTTPSTDPDSTSTAPVLPELAHAKLD